MTVYGLKHSTHKMQYHHMNMVLDWRRDLADRMHNPSEREQALKKIKEIMGNEPFDAWYREVHKLRVNHKSQEYENEIFKKLEELTAEE
jgi:hypothetical protein